MSHIKPRSASVPIYQGDDLERLADLRRAADAAERRVREAAAMGSARAGDEVSATAERAAYDAFVDEAAERAVIVELRAIGRKHWRALLADHPPRKETVDGKEQTVEDDRLYEVNTETFGEALLTFADGDVRTIVEPVFSTSAALREFVDSELSEGDFERLWMTAFWLNKAPGSDPKDSKFSPTI